MTSSQRSSSNSSRMCKPRSLLRLAIRAIICVILAWLLLALSWAFLPSPNPEPIDGNGIDYPTKTLLAGKLLTRVYNANRLISTTSSPGSRDGFALDYKFDTDNLAIHVGSEHTIPLFPAQETNETISRVEIRPSASAEQKRAMKEKEILYLRHKLQKSLLHPEGPNVEEMPAQSDILKKLESYSQLDADVIKVTNIHKVLKAIMKLPATDYLNQYDIQGRSDDLLQEYLTTLQIAATAGKQLDANVFTRSGDTDGANLPWFDFADAVLLYWQIHKDLVNINVSARLHKWSEGGGDFRKLELYMSTYVNPKQDITFLTLEIRDKDKSTIRVTVPERPISSSPSWTYPIRAAIIQILAPTAISINKLVNNTFGGIIQVIFTTFVVLLCVFLYGFLALAVIFSLWRCVGGPSFESSTQQVQNRLVILGQNKRLKFLKLGSLHDSLDSIYQSRRFKVALDICRHGWHPEADRKKAAEEEDADRMERAVYVKSEGVDISES